MAREERDKTRRTGITNLFFYVGEVQKMGVRHRGGRESAGRRLGVYYQAYKRRRKNL